MQKKKSTRYGYVLTRPFLHLWVIGIQQVKSIVFGKGRKQSSLSLLLVGACRCTDLRNIPNIFLIFLSSIILRLNHLTAVIAPHCNDPSGSEGCKSEMDRTRMLEIKPWSGFDLVMETRSRSDVRNFVFRYFAICKRYYLRCVYFKFKFC